MTAIAALAWTGCSDEPDEGGGRVQVDPGGTHGAEITLTIKGRGRVTTNVPGLDCPSDCFTKHVFANAQADGAAGAIALKATPTSGSRFVGWSFSTDPIGSRGRGPASCNPVLRPGSEPAVNKWAREIELPYGETTGTPPAGQEGACSAFTKVPVVYNVTATFETPDRDAGVGDDGGLPEIIYEPPTPGASSREVGITQGGYLYWRFVSGAGGMGGIAFGSTPNGVAHQTPTIVLDPTLMPMTIQRFEVDRYGVVFQASTGTVGAIRPGETTVAAMGGGLPGLCNALAIDASYDVYCRTSSTIVRWLASSSYASPNVLYTGLPNGTDLVVEPAFDSLYFSSINAILSLPITGADGSVASPTEIASGRSGPRHLEANGSHFFWVESDAQVHASSSMSAPLTVHPTGIAPPGGVQYLAADMNSPSHFWAASQTDIFHVHYLGEFGPGATRPFRRLSNVISGMTADSLYVYTAHNDGTIRRASRAGF